MQRWKGWINRILLVSFSDIQSLYSIDIETGTASLLHKYPVRYFDGAIEGITMMEERLFAIATGGKLYEINADTYEATRIGDLGSQCWTALVTVPEPSTIILIFSGIVLFLKRKSR